MAKKTLDKGMEEAKEYLSMLYKARDYGEEQYDKLIVYISSGALVLTVGLVKEIVDLNKTKYPFLLYFSWICFAFSLISILLSHKTCLITMNHAIKEEKEKKKDDKSRKSKGWNRFTSGLNLVALLSLMFGIILFVVFLVLEFSKKGG